MNVYRVHYDKASSGEDYDDLHAYLAVTADGLDRLTENEWLLRTEDSLEAIYDDLVEHLGGLGELSVKLAHPDLTNPRR